MAARKLRRRRRNAAGPASVAEREPGGEPTILRLIGCDSSGGHESTPVSPRDLTMARETWPLVWLDVDGFGDAATIHTVGQLFEIGELALGVSDGVRR